MGPKVDVEEAVEEAAEGLSRGACWSAMLSIRLMKGNTSRKFSE